VHVQNTRLSRKFQREVAESEQITVRKRDEEHKKSFRLELQRKKRTETIL